MIGRVDLHPALAAADAARLDERRLAIQALVEDVDAADPSTLALFVDVAPDGLLLVWLRGGEALARTPVSDASLRRHLDEYEAVCRRLGSLDEDSAGQRLEALDMAKKLAHDDAARTLAALCQPVAIDHATCRRLFTLVFGLRVDTTRLGRAHRAHHHP
ncbi:MAG: UPF0262 family protein [Polyangiaceae bacterium]|nr:UPF0262 family protein [Polyangiaceae bacterium]